MSGIKASAPDYRDDRWQSHTEHTEQTAPPSAECVEDLLYTVLNRVDALRAQRATLISIARLPHVTCLRVLTNLPAPTTELIGRETELGELLELMAVHNLREGFQDKPRSFKKQKSWRSISSATVCFFAS